MSHRKSKNVAEALANVIRSIDESTGADAPDDVTNGAPTPNALTPRQVVGAIQSSIIDDGDDDDASSVERTTSVQDGDDEDKNSTVEQWAVAVKGEQEEYSESGERQSCDRKQTKPICSCNNGSVNGQPRQHPQRKQRKMKSNKDKLILCTYSYMTDDQLLKSNIIVFIVNVTLWLPFILISIASQYRETFSVELRDAVWWFSALNCCSCSYIYALTNRDFRDAFNKLFYYCCCKSHVTFQRKTPVYRRQLDVDPDGNLRVHIIPGLNVHSNKQLMSNQNRATTTSNLAPTVVSTPLPASYSPVMSNEPATATGSLSMQMMMPNAVTGCSKSMTRVVAGSSSTKGLGPQHPRRQYHYRPRQSQASLSFGPSTAMSGRSDDTTTSTTSGTNRLRKTFGFGGPLFSHASSQHHQYGRNDNLQHL